ncbi:MAG: hypothetical protein ACHQWU_06315 [Gemmatimonadales bacterium]
MVTRRGLVIAAPGVALGLLGALAANRLLTSLLYGVRPDDFATLATVCGSLLAVAAAASILPARASTRIDPVQALRAE